MSQERGPAIFISDDSDGAAAVDYQLQRGSESAVVTVAT
jgi:hypothetical protein